MGNVKNASKKEGSLSGKIIFRGREYRIKKEEYDRFLKFQRELNDKMKIR